MRTGHRAENRKISLLSVCRLNVRSIPLRSEAMKFQLPERALFQKMSATNSYGFNNYFGRGPIAWLKRRRFQIALDLAQGIDSRRTVDMGCADGVLLPTLAGEYEDVVAIDINPRFTKQCEQLIHEFKLNNVTVICNQSLEPAQLACQIGAGVKLLWLLETLEHVGSQPDIWNSKLEFLQGCFQLLDEDGSIIISVPKMVGISFLIKYLVQNYILGVKHDKMSFRNLMSSVFLKNTDNLEPMWEGGHLGFNHLKLDNLLETHFEVERRVETSISCLYRIRKKL